MIVWILSWLATVMTTGFFLSGFVTIKKMVDKNSTDNVQFLPFLMTLMNCVLWTSYGLLKDDATIIRVNVVGTILQVIYILIFLHYSTTKRTELRLICYIAVAGLVVYLYMTKVITDEIGRTAQLGWLCTVVTILMMASPLATVAEVIKTKSTETIPFAFSLLITIQSIIWFCYGLAVHDINIQLPNGSGVVLGAIQLFLFCIFPSSPLLPKHTVNVA